jgi:hypothetical protein
MLEKFPEENIDLPEIGEGETLEERNQKEIDKAFGVEEEQKNGKERSSEDEEDRKQYWVNALGGDKEDSFNEDGDSIEHESFEGDEKQEQLSVEQSEENVRMEQIDAVQEKKEELEEAKEKFIKKYQEHLKTRRLRESVGFSQKEENWSDELYSLKWEYRNAKIALMEDEYKKKKEDLFEQMPSMRTNEYLDMEDAHESALEANKEMDREYFSAKIFNEIELSEEEDIQKARMEALSTKERNFIMNGLSWYSKRSMASRLAVTTAIVTGAMVGGGAVAATGAGVYATQRTLRALSGILFGKLAGKIGESSIKRTEKKTQEEFEKEFDVNLLFRMEGKAKDRLDKIESQKKKLLIAKTATAIAAGMLSGLTLKDVDVQGTLNKYIEEDNLNTEHSAEVQSAENIDQSATSGQGIREVSYQQKDWFEDSNQTISDEDAIKGYYDQTAGHGGLPGDIESLSKDLSGEITHEVKTGDNLWKAIEGKLEKQGLFESMENGQKTHLIDEIKDKFAKMSPEDLKKIGVSSGNIDQLKIGDKLDFSSVLGDDQFISDAVSHADTLSGQQITHIEANDKIIADWHRMNPEESLTAEKIDELLKGEHGAKVEKSAPFVSELDGGRAGISGQDQEVEPDTFSEQERLELEEEVRENVKTDLDKLYGTITSSYEDSADWQDLKDRSVEDIMKKTDFEATFPDESTQTGFDSEQEVEKMQKHLRYLEESTRVKPTENETVESYIKRATWVDVVGDDEITVPEVVKAEIPKQEIINNVSDKDIEVAGAESEDVDATNEEIKITEDSGEDGSQIEQEIKVPENPELVEREIAGGEAVKITTNDLMANIKFEYDENGNPVKIESLDYNVAGSKGTEFTDLKALDKWLEENNARSLEHVHRDNVIKSGRELTGLVRIYEELAHEGEARQAMLISERIGEKVSEIHKEYGTGVVDMDKLNDRLLWVKGI